MTAAERPNNEPMTTELRTERRRKRGPWRVACVVLVVPALAVAILSGPVATWLQCHDRRPGVQAVEVVYLVAGSGDQARRVHGLVAYLNEAEIPSRVLVHSDPLKGGWSRKEQRNLSVGEWAVETIMTQARVPCEVLAGDYASTREEMRALASWAGERGVTSVGLATSPYHARRCVVRLTETAVDDLTVLVLPVETAWRGRYPWTVVSELLKIRAGGGGR